MNNIKVYCDNIYRKYNKIKLILEDEKAGYDAIMGHFGKQGEEIYKMELEKSGRLKTLKHRINERLDMIHTKYQRMIEEFNVNDMFKEYTAEDLDPAEFAKHKSATAQKKAIEKLAVSAKKDLESKLIETLGDKNLAFEIMDVIIEAYKLAEERNHDLFDHGHTRKARYTSKFID